MGRAGHAYFDLNSGFGMFAVGRNHPDVRQALIDFMASDYPSLVSSMHRSSRNPRAGTEKADAE